MEKTEPAGSWARVSHFSGLTVLPGNCVSAERHGLDRRAPHGAGRWVGGQRGGASHLHGRERASPHVLHFLTETRELHPKRV